MQPPHENEANRVGVLVDESGRRKRWLRRGGSAISLLCVLFMLSVVASVFAPDGFVGLRLPVVAPAGTTPALPKAVQACGSSDGLLPQVFVEADFSAMLAFDVEDGAFRDRNIQHLFQTHGLSAELHFVIVPATFLSASQPNFLFLPIEGKSDAPRFTQ